MKNWFFRTSQKLLASSYVRLTSKQIKIFDPHSRAIVLACIPLQMPSEHLESLSEDVLFRQLDCTSDEVADELQKIERAHRIRNEHYKKIINLSKEGDFVDTSDFEQFWSYSSVALNVLGSSVGAALTKNHNHNKQIEEIWSRLNEAVIHLDSAIERIETWEQKSPDFLNIQINRFHPFFFHLANNKDRWKESATGIASAFILGKMADTGITQ